MTMRRLTNKVLVSRKKGKVLYTVRAVSFGWINFKTER
jgi:hypothetical protein